MNLGEILKARGKSVEDVKQIYYGLDNHCRCGCGGKYADEGTPLFKRYLTKLASSEAQGPIQWSPPARGAGWVNIPTNRAADKCFCLYFEK